MKLRSNRAFLVLITLMVTGQSVAAQNCDTNCAKVKHFIAVMNATMESCGKAFPSQKEQFASAFKNWELLKYHIPGLHDLLSERTPELQEARGPTAEAVMNSPREEQAIQCSGYKNALVHQDLFLPQAMLAGYGHDP